MSNDRKQVTSEELPRPEPVIPSVEVRARVTAHLRNLLAMGATSLSIAACPPMVCDPLPPPARCKTDSTASTSLKALVLPTAGGDLDVLFSSLDLVSPSAVTLTFASISGGSEVPLTTSTVGLPSVRVTPASTTTPVVLVFSASCNGTPVKSIRVTLTPRGVDGGDAGAGWDTTIGEVP